MDAEVREAAVVLKLTLSPELAGRVARLAPPLTARATLVRRLVELGLERAESCPGALRPTLPSEAPRGASSFESTVSW